MFNLYEEKILDVAIVGCGPAGLSASINLQIRNMDFSILGAEFCSPKLYKAREVNNYLGFYNISGAELREAFLNHISGMDIPIERGKVDNIYYQGDYYTLVSRNASYNAYAVILAVGVSNTKYLAGEENLIGSGVSYCATCDGVLYKGKKVAVIAYTDEGMEEAEYLSELVELVYFIPLYNFTDSFKQDNIELINDKPQAIKGEMKVEALKLNDREIEIDGVFIFREVTPPDKLIFGLELTGPHIRVNEQMETNLPGLYAAGDCTGIPYQLGRAVGQGQLAGLNAAAFVRQYKKKAVLT